MGLRSAALQSIYLGSPLCCSQALLLTLCKRQGSASSGLSGLRDDAWRGASITSLCKGHMPWHLAPLATYSSATF